MKLTTEDRNQNYTAVVITARTTTELDGLDNLVGVPVMGRQALTTKADLVVGGLYLLFTSETQLSEQYASLNNLYRHSDRNADKDVKGYLEDNRRVRAIRLRGHRSDALIMPLDSLRVLGIDPSGLKDGDSFDSIDGIQICQKYFIRGEGGLNSQGQPAYTRVDKHYFPEHFDTPNAFRVFNTIFDQLVTVTQKLHGTSVRVGHVNVPRPLKWYEKLARKVGIKVNDREWAYVYGSRRTVKDPDAHPGYYGSDLYTQIGQLEVEGLLPRGYVLYGEIVGYVPGTSRPIQEGFTYGYEPGTAGLYVYRVAHVSDDGVAVDLSWSAVKQFCNNLGLKTVPEITYGLLQSEEDITQFLDIRLQEIRENALPVDEVDEGVCIRVEGLTPIIAKAKSPKFLQHETKMADAEILDIEEEQFVDDTTVSE